MLFSIQGIASPQFANTVTMTLRNKVQSLSKKETGKGQAGGALSKMVGLRAEIASHMEKEKQSGTGTVWF